MRVTGWDIGGAHLKAALVERGHLVRAIQVPCPLWQGMHHLEAAFREAESAIGAGERHAITMTGELADLFNSRDEGVQRILGCSKAKLGDAIAVYAGRAGFVPADAAHKHVEDIAAANWYATASLCARRWHQGLLIDIGSTTADMIPFKDGRIVAAGYDDTSRLTARELVYTAAVRTPVIAVARDALFNGERVPLMAELFATMADVYRLTGALPDETDQGATADGRGKSAPESAARLARMIGRNAGDAPMAVWRTMAEDLRQSQLATLVEAARTVGADAGLAGDAPVIIAGAGSFLAKSVAEAVGRPHVPFDQVLDAPAALRAMASQCAPAVAVALLLETGQARDFAVA